MEVQLPPSVPGLMVPQAALPRLIPTSILLQRRVPARHPAQRDNTDSEVGLPPATQLRIPGNQLCSAEVQIGEEAERL